MRSSSALRWTTRARSSLTLAVALGPWTWDFFMEGVFIFDLGSPNTQGWRGSTIEFVSIPRNLSAKCNYLDSIRTANCTDAKSVNENKLTKDLSEKIKRELVPQ